jgi:GT2 family glycosyltransferase
MPSVRILVLNYNRKDLLERFMPSILEAARASRNDCKVSVVDNASTDGSVGLVRKNFPEADAFVLSENKVLCAFNDAARHYSEDVLIFLNNDIRTEKDFVDPLVRVFIKNPDAFFAASYGDRALPVSRWGVLGADIYYDGFEDTILRPGYSFSAGIGAFDRKKFLELGGYDPMYLPAYYEDVDLCYRGWKRGYRGYHVPQSHQYHVGGASFNRAYEASWRQKLAFRNSVLFMVKNVTDPWLFLKFLFFLKIRVLAGWLFAKPVVKEGFAEAVKKWPEAWRGRQKERPAARVADRDILSLVRGDILKDR